MKYIYFGFGAFLGLFVILLGFPYRNKIDNEQKVRTTPTAAPILSVDKTPKQFVLLSFDGSESMIMWEATRKFAAEMKVQKKPVHFTYFVSGVYFLTEATKNKYQGPGQKIGVSKIGFSKSEADIVKRTEELNFAQSEGHEIGSHLNGHFNGSQWTVADWSSEVEQFQKLVPVKKIVGMRAPLLARNESFYQTLPKFGFTYDGSGVGKMGEMPQKNAYGTWEIPLVTITLPASRKSTLSMDYNLYVTQTGARDILRRNTPEWKKAFDEVVAAYRNYFYANYQKNGTPIVIANHFSAWNDGLYWEAMKAFALEVCGKENVVCGTYSEFVTYLNSR